MTYSDNLYDQWEPPEIVEKLMHTQEMIRLRNITQAVMPNNVSPHGPIPSRFQHGMGVCRLVRSVIGQNAMDEQAQNLLFSSALLHDAGNPPLSHLSEPFLKELAGRDGESFLQEIISGSETEEVLRDFGLTVDEVVAVVTGQTEFSKILNGSLDMDNLDNVARYFQAVFLCKPGYDGQRIASAFGWNGDKWCLKNNGNVLYDVNLWKKNRRMVYSRVYSSEHLCAAMMVFRALDIAFRDGKIKVDFFHNDDIEAVNFLVNSCGTASARLIDMALRWQWYTEVFNFETTDPDKINVGKFDNYWASRSELADHLCRKLGKYPDAICVYLGKGRDVKEIAIPFLDGDGKVFYDNERTEFVYRLKVFIRPDLAVSRSLIKEWVSEIMFV